MVARKYEIYFECEQDWLAYFLCVFKYDFSQWPKTLCNIDVYKIKQFIEYLDKFRSFNWLIMVT